MNEEAKKNVELKLREYFSKLQDVFHFSDSDMVQTLLGSAVDLGFEREVFLRERDEARAAESTLRVGLNTAIRDRDEARRIALQMMAERDELSDRVEMLKLLALRYSGRGIEDGAVIIAGERLEKFDAFTIDQKTGLAMKAGSAGKED